MSTQPFCCTSAIPITFTRLLSLLPTTTAHALLSASSPTSAGLLTTFLASTTQSRVYAVNTNPPLPPNTSLCPEGSFRAIIQITKLIPTKDSSEDSKTYYVPYGRGDRDKVQQGEKEELFGVMWKEISQEEAGWCLKLPGSGVEIGDGESWEELEGMEKLWCEGHMVFWELKAFVRKSE